MNAQQIFNIGQQWLDRYRSGDLKNDAFDWQDVRVREYGDAAIAIGVQLQKTFHKGQEMSGRFRVSHLYVRKMDRWLIAHIGLAVQGFALLGTLVGLFTIAVGVGPRTVPDLVFHAGIVAVLVWGLIVTARAVSKGTSEIN